MRKFQLLGPSLGLAAMFALCQQAQANYIDGTIDLTGTATINNTGPLDATAFAGFSGVTVSFADGSYSGTTGASVTLKPFSFNPADSNINDLWSFTSGGNSYSFDLSSMTLDFQGVPSGGPGLGDIRVAGTGTAHATGFQDTPASWVLHSSGGQSELILAMGSTTVASAPVPDGGNSALLLSGALGGLGLLERKLRIL